MTATIEDVAIHTALWGDPEQVLDVIDAGAWHPEHFTDPSHRRTAEVVVTLVLGGVVPWPEVVLDRLMGDGLDFDSAKAAVLVPGAFVAARMRLDGLGYWLHVLAEEHARRAVMGHLVALADSVSRPGGPLKVAAVLGVEVAA